MGVRRFHQVLQEEGWLPDAVTSSSSTRCHCSTSIWRDPAVMHSCPKFAANVSMVKRRSTLLIDGAGLAFHLHRVAYARQIAQVIGNRRGASGSCCSIKNLKPEHVTPLLPNLLPLSKLEEVTREFVDVLKTKHHMKLVVYFDGEFRRQAKQETDEKRREKRPDEWSALQQYCCNGIMPRVDRICQLEQFFPKNRLFLTQVKYTLKVCQVNTVQCKEEADAEIARVAFHTPNSYVLGNDTDFCFFPPQVRYIPLQTLSADSNVVSACVITRKILAETLHLPDEAALVELAILMGNDYVGNNPTRDKLDYYSPHAKDILHHLRTEGEGYRVTSLSGEETAMAIRFARAFYNLQDLDQESPLCNLKEKAAEDSEEDDDEEKEEDALTMKIPKKFPTELAMIQPHDLSLTAAVLRCLQAYVDQDNAKIQQKHLEAMRLLSLYRQDDSNVPWRPNWEDIPASFLIESCIAYVSKQSADSPVVRLSPPRKVFDAYRFHWAIYKLQSSQETPPAKPISQSAAAQSSAQSNDNTKRKIEPRLVLPIDEHEATILDAVNRNRVTIIQGETGCGKSSRVPIMIMKAPNPDPALSEVKLFISQPRRIAAKALVERLRATEPELGPQIALRMGHGVREYESSATRAWFVTTGYLVRLLSNHPEKFNKISHLVIDEIHERSVDTDILCLLCRRLMYTNPHIRLVLMSATLAASLYQGYFNIREPPIKVGVRRFPIEEVFVEDIPNKLRLPPKEIKAVQHIAIECQKTKCIAAPSNNTMELVYGLAARIAISVGKPGSSVLIFVPGMRDIEGIVETIEKIYVPGVAYACIPVHGDIPFEDQMKAFDETDEVKIIVATNAAESSITLPDCDHVICTGLQKQITYNASSHRQMLTPTWISRASAQQRSGRVGRVRPGTVFRLYTRDAYDTYMKEFESGEMLRMPLDSVILMLKEILNEETTPALLDCLEPPDLSTIERSYNSLFKSNFISQPGDHGEITHLGAFVSALGIDLTLGALIGLGIQFGVGPEAIELAAVLSFPKTPWLVSNPLVHKAKMFNAGTAKAYCSKNQFDASIFSEPIATMNIMYEYSRLHGSKVSAFCNYHGVHNTRIKRLISTAKNLATRVADFVGLDPSLLKLREPLSKAPHAKLSLLRILQVWVFHETIIEYTPPLKAKLNHDGTFPLRLKGIKALEESHLGSLLRKDRHPFSLRLHSEFVQSGGFAGDTAFDFGTFLVGFEERFVSYAIQKGLDLCWFSHDDGLQLYVCSSACYEQLVCQSLRTLWDDTSDESVLFFVETSASNRRGRGERDCGKWSMVQDSLDGKTVAAYQFVKIHKFNLRGKGAGISNGIRAQLRKHCKVGLAIDFSRSRNKKKNRGNVVFQTFCGGTNAFKVSDIDLCDMLSISRLDPGFFLLDRNEDGYQTIVFESVDAAEMRRSDALPSPGRETDSSIKQPLLRNAPEGARLLTVLAASRRKNKIEIPLPSAEDPEEEDEEELITFSLETDMSNLQSRWTRMGTNRKVFVMENSVCSSVIPVESIGTLYACCANTLDLRGGGMRADNLTLLPPGGHFLLLALLAFGLTPDELHFPEEDDDLEAFIAACVAWAKQRGPSESGTENRSLEIDWDSKFRMAFEFGRSCYDLGEQLKCFPEKVKNLCVIFDSVDGYSVDVWPKLEADPFIPLSAAGQKQRELVLAGLQRPGQAYGRMDSGTASEPGQPPVAIGLGQHLLGVTAGRTSEDKPMLDSEEEEKKETVAERVLRGEEVLVFSEQLVAGTQAMFSAELNSGEKVLTSTNILTLMLKQYFAGLQYEAFMHLDRRNELLSAVARFGAVKLDKDHWIVFRFVDQDGNLWYHAIFLDKCIPLKGRGDRGWVYWHRHSTSKPWKTAAALECAPPLHRNITMQQAEVYIRDNKKRTAILFSSIEDALRMEAAFWLEANFGTKEKHWYEQSFPELSLQLMNRMPSTEEILKKLKNQFTVNPNVNA